MLAPGLLRPCCAALPKDVTRFSPDSDPRTSSCPSFSYALAASRASAVELADGKRQQRGQEVRLVLAFDAGSDTQPYVALGFIRPISLAQLIGGTLVDSSWHRNFPANGTFAPVVSISSVDSGSGPGSAADPRTADGTSRIEADTGDTGGLGVDGGGVSEATIVLNSDGRGRLDIRGVQSLPLAAHARGDLLLTVTVRKCATRVEYVQALTRRTYLPALTSRRQTPPRSPKWLQHPPPLVPAPRAPPFPAPLPPAPPPIAHPTFPSSLFSGVNAGAEAGSGGNGHRDSREDATQRRYSSGNWARGRADDGDGGGGTAFPVPSRATLSALAPQPEDNARASPTPDTPIFGYVNPIFTTAILAAATPAPAAHTASDARAPTAGFDSHVFRRAAIAPEPGSTPEAASTLPAIFGRLITFMGVTALVIFLAAALALFLARCREARALPQVALPIVEAEEEENLQQLQSCGGRVDRPPPRPPRRLLTFPFDRFSLSRPRRARQHSTSGVALTATTMGAHGGEGAGGGMAATQAMSGREEGGAAASVGEDAALSRERGKGTTSSPHIGRVRGTEGGEDEENVGTAEVGPLLEKA